MNKLHHHILCRWAVVVTMLACMPHALWAQLQAEYYIDVDPGLGNATTIATPIETEGLLQMEIPTNGLAPGYHLIGIRAYNTIDEEGQSITTFGPTITQRIVVREKKSAQQVLYAEYYFDDDPGFGNGIPIPVTPGESLNLDNLELPTTDLEAGDHIFGIRTYGTSGWGPTIIQRFVIKEEKTPQEVLHAEYYFDEDPGFGNGIPIPVTPGENLNLDNLELPTTDLDAGDHIFGIRSYGTSGWGPTITQRIVIKEENVNLQVLYAEYFFGDDPGFGQGTPIIITPGEEVSIEDLQLPTDDVHGVSILGIRAYGTKGWGPTILTDVMLGAEGDYTLNAKAQTNLANRNYQSLGEAINDFSVCGVKGDVTFTVTTNNTNYSLDATASDCLAKMTSIIESFDGTENEKVITFTAEEGSGNSLAITTTDEGMPTVVSLFSHVVTTNVSLTINGVAYDFTAAATRHQEVCPGTATELVELSGISSKVNANWTAQPHDGNLITGYEANGSGDLSAMILDNTGAKCDTLIVNVVLTDDNGRTLTTYDYSYIVHASVSNQAFTKFSPTDGSNMEPGIVKLRWKPIGDAIGYRVSVLHRPIDDDFEDDIEQIFETEGTEYEMTVESGMLYTWTVTAIGYCDELTSNAISFTVNDILLGDVNGDGYVTIADVMLTVNHVLGNNPPAFIERNADINGDHRITIADIMSIVKIILGN